MSDGIDLRLHGTTIRAECPMCWGRGQVQVPEGPGGTWRLEACPQCDGQRDVEWDVATAHDLWMS